MLKSQFYPFNWFELFRKHPTIHFYLFFISILLIGCSGQYDRALRSKNPEFIYVTAENELKKEKWNKAITLYDYAIPFFIDSDTAKLIAYNSAFASYKVKDYETAARKYKSYYERYQDKKEEALYMSGYCFYLASPPYSIDQETTYQALEILQSFINKYPESEKSKDINGYLDDLRRKLEKKSYEIAYTYFQIFEYNAAVVSFSNLLEKFPDTVYKEKVYLYIMRSRYELAISSVKKSKKNRLKEAILSVESFINKFPESEYKSEAIKLKKKLEFELNNFIEDNIP